MMPGRCFVQRKRLHAELRLRFQVESVDVEDAGSRSIRGRALVIGAGRRLRAVRLHLADLVIRLRQHREQLRQCGVDAHLQVAIALQQVRALREIELRIRLQVVEERLEVALEANFPPHPVHLAEDPRDLVEADLVDLLRRHVGRRVSLHEERIPGLAVGQRGPRHRRARLRQIVVTDVVANPAVGGHDFAVDGRPVRGRQPLPVRDRHRVRELRDRSVERAVLRLRHDQGIELRQDLLHYRPGLHHALRHAVAHVDDRLVHEHDETVEALEPVLVVRDRDERLGVGAGAEGRHHRGQTAGLRERQQVARETLGLALAHALAQEDLVRDAVLARQAAPGRTPARPRDTARSSRVVRARYSGPMEFGRRSL